MTFLFLIDFSILIYVFFVDFNTGEFVFLFSLSFFTYIVLNIYSLLVFASHYNWFLRGIFIPANFLFLDGFSFIFVLLVFINIPFIFVYAIFRVLVGVTTILSCLILLNFFLFFLFMFRNFFFFYITFEFLLVPMVLIIGFWGSRGRKIHALIYFFYYTFLSSFFLVIAFFIIVFAFGSLDFCRFPYLFAYWYSFIIIFFFFFGFIAKVPSVPFHIWLPEAHVEAHTIGSVILASILLKLGYFGLYKTVFCLLHTFIFFYIKSFLTLFFLISFIFGSFNVICQIDLKKIIAYSSIIHMNFAMLGFLNFNFGLLGSWFLMLSHGLISSGLFFSVGFLYDRFHSRNVLYFGGLVQFMPIFSALYFLLLLANSSFPGTSNFVGEFLVFLSLFNFSFTILFFLILGLVLVSLFCLLLLVRVIFYQVSSFLVQNLYDLEFFEFLIIFFILIFIVLFGVQPNLVINLVVFCFY